MKDCHVHTNISHDGVSSISEYLEVTPTKYEKVGVISFDEFYKNEKIRLVFHLYMVYE